MSNRRVIIGKKASGHYGLRVSLPGYDPLVDGDAFMTYDDEWSDLVKVVQAGLVSCPANTIVDIPIVTLGYKPYIETRQVNGTQIFDDWNSSFGGSGSYGIGIGITDGMLSFQYGFQYAATQLVLVYAIPVSI